ncbi:unnamed protein product, partial [Mesorhabditis belari]|uniref:ZSWIM3 N-terminal domain-containing protein n=1 Tax=Mesorhabditis belari TaxID=2138241 RepID=A0AAF3EA20_9BILA
MDTGFVSREGKGGLIENGKGIGGKGTLRKKRLAEGKQKFFAAMPPPLSLPQINAAFANPGNPLPFSSLPIPLQAKTLTIDVTKGNGFTWGHSPDSIESTSGDEAHTSSSQTTAEFRASSEESPIDEDPINNDIDVISSDDTQTDSGNSSAPSPVEQNAQLFPKTIKNELSVDTRQAGPIFQDARFNSFKEFEEAFDLWKAVYYHPFRTASSETLREPGGAINEIFKYRYIVYHCAHYGQPRMRGVGKRPNQNYLPCGCRAMLRLNYNFNEKVLKITTLQEEHTGHELGPEGALGAKKTRKSPSTCSPTIKRRKSESKEITESPISATCANPLSQSQVTPQLRPSSIPPSPIFSTNVNPNLAALMAQQRLVSIFSQHQKENLGIPATTPSAQPFSATPVQRPFGTTTNIPSNQALAQGMLMNMFNLQQRFVLMQPPHGLVAPLAPPAAEPTAASTLALPEQKTELLTVKDEVKEEAFRQDSPDPPLGIVRPKPSLPSSFTLSTNREAEISGVLGLLSEVLQSSDPSSLPTKLAVLHNLHHAWKCDTI